MSALLTIETKILSGHWSWNIKPAVLFSRGEARDTSEKWESEQSEQMLSPLVIHSKQVFNNSLKSERRHVTVVTTQIQNTTNTDSHHHHQHPPSIDSRKFGLFYRQLSKSGHGSGLMDEIYILKQKESSWGTWWDNRTWSSEAAKY